MTSNWKECKIGDLCDSISDSYKRNDKKVVLINTSDVLEGKILNHELVDNKNLKGQFKKTFQKYDILYSEIRPANKRFAFVDIEDTYNYIASTKLMVIRPDLKKVLPKYLYMILKSQPIIDELQHLAETRSGTFPQITFSSELSQVEILLPSLETQQKIAKVLSAIDDKIELNNSINNNLEQQAQAIFKSWFTDFEPFGGVMPIDWNIGKLEDIVDFSNGYAFKSSELLSRPNGDCYEVFKQGHINRGGGFNPSGTKSWYPKDKAKNLEKFILKKGDVLMAMTDMKDNVAILGNTALMGINDQYIVNQRVGLLRPKNDYNISYPFIYILTNSTDFLTDLRKRANSGVQVNLSSTEIKISEVVIATKDINSKFDNIVKPFFEQIFINNMENTRLIQLRDTLLPKLMSGEIDVSNVDISTDKLSFSENNTGGKNG